MNKKFLCRCLISLGLLLFFTFLPQIMPTSVSIARASDIEKEKNNEYRLNLRAITLVNGKSFTLKVYNLEKDAKVSFKSADPEIASVSDDGTFTAHKVGSTTITATVRRRGTSTPLLCEVTVGPPAFSVKLTQSRLILGVDQSFLLEAILKPMDTAELSKFSSRDSSIASVSSGGRVTAKKVGMTYVFAEIDYTNPDGSRKFSSCSVIVSNPEDVSSLNDYFSSRVELSMISETDLSQSLYEFFNSEEGVTPETALAEVQKAQNASSADASSRTDANTKKSTDTATNQPAAANTGEAASLSDAGSKVSLIESLDKHLDSKFNLSELKQKYEERLQAAITVQ